MGVNKLLLEIVPPLLYEGRDAWSRRADYIHQVMQAVSLQAVNIPEIHAESDYKSEAAQARPHEPRVTPREFATYIRETCGVDCIINHVVVHEPAEALVRWLEESYSQFGIRQFVLVGSAHSYIDYLGPGVCEANALAYEVFKDKSVRIGNICIPARHNEAQRVRKKCQSGASFFTTQIIYHVEELIALHRSLTDAAENLVDTEFFISFCPLSTQRNFRFLNWLGVSVSKELEQWLQTEPDEMMARSQEHICQIWERFLFHTRDSELPFNTGINLSPIGKISVADIVRLAVSLHRISDQVGCSE